MIPKHLSGGHWYDINGEPKHFVEKKDGSGLRSSTLADARKNGWLPSPTTILKVLDKPALNEWRIKNAIEATLTTPRMGGESLDDFASRVMQVDVDSISDAAKQLGTTVHDAIEKRLNGEIVDMTPEIAACVNPVLAKVAELGKVVFTEKTLVGQGYSGRCDCAVENDNTVTIIDFKTSGAKTLPKKSYPEHMMQLASYGKAFGFTGDKRIRTCNIYISTVRHGEISVSINDDWEKDWTGFSLAFSLWQYLNNYNPKGIQ